MVKRSLVRAADGVQLAVRVEGSGPALVLVSGLGGLGEYWAPLVEALSNAFRVLTYDHRGAGASSRTDTAYTLQEMTADLLAVIDDLGEERVILMGHSTGGVLAQRVAIEHPDRVKRLVLSATWARPCAYFRRLFECRLETLEAAGIGAYTRQSELFLHTPRWLATHSPQAPRSMPRDAFAEQILRRKIGAILTHDSLDRLPALRCPTMAIVAADDAVTPPHLSREMAQRIPGCRLEVLPAGGHYALHEQPESYTRSIAEFLAG